MPHVNIKYHPVDLTEEQRSELLTVVSNAVQSAFSVPELAVSISLEPVEKEVWHESVYVPEIINRKDLLHKAPGY